MKKKADTDEVAMTLRLPAELHRKLITEAEEFNYTLTGYIIELLDERFETLAKIRYRKRISRGRK